MDLNEMEKRFKTAIVDLGLNAEQATALGGALIQTEKDATAQGIAFKSSPADITINGVVYTVKDIASIADAGVAGAVAGAALKAAPPPMIEGSPEEEAAEPPDEAMAEGDMMDAQPEGDYVGDMTVDEFFAKLSELLAPVLKMQDMHKGMTDALGEMKAMYGGVATKDQSELIALKAQYADLAAKIATIEGDQPNTILPDEVAAALKSAGPATPAKPDDPAKQEALNDPQRPFAWLAMQAMPELYNQNGANE